MFSTAVFVHQSSHPTRRRIGAAVVLLTSVALLASACSDDGGGTAAAGEAAAPADPAESAYCRTALEWQVHELTPFDDSDPATLEQYMGEYVGFYESAAGDAPAELQEDWDLALEGLTTQLVPVMERYDYDIARMQAEATPEEAAVLQEPPPDIAAAQDRIHAYEAEVCGAGQPAPAAGAHFTGSPDSAYCQAVRRFDEATGTIQAAGFAPEDLQAFVTSGQAEELLTAMVDAAPEEIAADGAAVLDYERQIRLPLLAAYDYDVRRILLEGDAGERAQFQYTDPAISGPFTRTAAYDAQVCGVEGGE